MGAATQMYPQPTRFSVERVNTITLEAVADYLCVASGRLLFSDSFLVDLRLDRLELTLICYRIWRLLEIDPPTCDVSSIRTVQDLADVAKSKLGDRVIA